MSILYTRKRSAPTQAVLLAFQALPGILLTAFAVTNASVIAPPLWAIVVLWAAAAALALMLAAWHVLGEESVGIDDHSIRVQRRIGPLSRVWTTPLVDVRDIQVVEPGGEGRLNDVWGLGAPRLRVKGKGRTLKMALAASAGEAALLADQLKGAVWPVASSAGSEQPGT